ncbi:hypothetical protein KM914_14275 [Virgibacillus pantothenticus]|uniref:hypothetical protein n=1 Tax=Virgibacillus pantothenticus TaxID=1473 RepID=UPI001C24BB41|nr:hypothetical protein [Virgibacillus pantothenticus]MBU8567586.1 hypothetical protein [Virgibacillus pantothenticus]MBU8601374.1 hypothetical protein [Virgibacillus pantothenticus]MBU8636191.1 hypothetical protein [Virgibacillus pantothenticus]MBU8643711.1 hypothetical protein [Virgibacillus pantothenticus]MBU8648033.1 hypothetical protein [Virgibacillus pantothenticus]
MQSPQLQLFNELFNRSLALGYQTVEYQKDSGLSYPFVHIGERVNEDIINNKQVITGRLLQTVHVWAYAHNRSLFDEMMFRLQNEFRKITRLPNYYLKLEGLNANDMYDNTTSDDLLHGVIEVEYRLL